MFIFSRPPVIAGRLSYIWLFRRIIRPDCPIQGSIAFDRGTGYRLTAIRLASLATIFGVATSLSPSGWLLGGFVGCATLAGHIFLLGLRSHPALRPSEIKDSKEAIGERGRGANWVDIYQSDFQRRLFAAPRLWG